MNNFNIKSILALLLSLNIFFGCESEEEPHEPKIREEAGETAGSMAGEVAGTSAGDESIAGDMTEAGTPEVAGDLVAGEDVVAGTPEVAGDLVTAGEEDDCLVELVCDEGFVQVEGCDVTAEDDLPDTFCLPLTACDETIYCQELLVDTESAPSADMGM